MKNRKLWICVILFVLSLLAGSSVAQSPELPVVIELSTSNCVSVIGPITDDSIKTAQQDFYKLINKRGKSTYPIYIVFDSPGGSVDAGLRFYETVKAYDNINTVVIRGYSMAAILPQLIAGKRYVLESGEFLFHPMKSADPRPNTTEQQAASLKTMQNLENSIEKRVAARAKMNQAKYREQSRVEWTLLADEAVRLGFADKIVTIKCTQKLVNTYVTVIEQFLPFLPPVETKRSACPIQL